MFAAHSVRSAARIKAQRGFKVLSERQVVLVNGDNRRRRMKGCGKLKKNQQKKVKKVKSKRFRVRTTVQINAGVAGVISNCPKILHPQHHRLHLTVLSMLFSGGGRGCRLMEGAVFSFPRRCFSGLHHPPSPARGLRLQQAASPACLRLFKDVFSSSSRRWEA